MGRLVVYGWGVGGAGTGLAARNVHRAQEQFSCVLWPYRRTEQHTIEHIGRDHYKKKKNLGEILPTKFLSTIFLSCLIKQNFV